MYKPNSLQQHLLGAIEDLKKNPEKLLIFADEGNAIARAIGTLSFEYSYKLNLIITDYPGKADAIMIPLLAWVAIHQVDLIGNDEKRKTGIRFQVDFNSKDSIDLDITLDLTEIVVVAEGDSGRLDVRHKGEPQLEPVDTATIWTLFAGQKKLAQWRNPAPDPA
jgi:hypothetical protein